jgi:hypothetical protein
MPLMTFVVRADIDAMSLVKSVGAAVHAIDPELPLADVRTMEGVGMRPLLAHASWLPCWRRSR